MARLLIRMKDNNRRDHPNPEMAYRPGDIVAVLPDGHVPGRLEKEPNFLWVDYPGVPEERFKRFMEPEWDQEQEAEWDNLQREDGAGREVRQLRQRRLYQFDRQQLSVAEEAVVSGRRPHRLVVDDTSGDVSRTRMDQLLKNKRTQQTIEDEGRRV